MGHLKCNWDDIFIQVDNTVIFIWSYHPLHQDKTLVKLIKMESFNNYFCQT